MHGARPPFRHGRERCCWRQRLIRQTRRGRGTSSRMQSSKQVGVVHTHCTLHTLCVRLRSAASAKCQRVCDVHGHPTGGNVSNGDAIVKFLDERARAVLPCLAHWIGLCAYVAPEYCSAVMCVPEQSQLPGRHRAPPGRGGPSTGWTSCTCDGAQLGVGAPPSPTCGGLKARPSSLAPEAVVAFSFMLAASNWDVWRLKSLASPASRRGEAIQPASLIVRCCPL